jgi:hypothetical protein
MGEKEDEERMRMGGEAQTNKVIELIKFLTISVKAHLMRNVLCPT